MSIDDKKNKAKGKVKSDKVKPKKKTASKKEKKNVNIDDFIAESVTALEKVTGAGVTQLLGSDGLAIKIKQVISTQCATLDHAIGRGGVPTSRLTIIHGGEGSGKTTLSLHLAAQVQKLGGLCVYIDKEYKLDPEYAAKIGVDVKRLVLSQPQHLEQTMEVISATIAKANEWRKATGKDVPVLVILDSMNACISKAEFEGDWDDQFYAPSARVFSKTLPKIIPIASDSNVALVWISQVRENIGVMFGNKDSLAGGKAPKFYASLILEVKNVGRIKAGENTIGNKIQVTCKKNQIAPPFKTANFNIMYGKGIDFESSLIELGLDYEVIDQSGAWYSFEGVKLGQGMVNSAASLADDPEMCAAIEKSIEQAKIKEATADDD